MGALPLSKWRFLRHLGLPDNSLTSITAASLAPLANTLHSLDLSSNHFAHIPDSLASLTALRALNLSNCMIDSLHSLTRNPLPAILALNLRANRLSSIAGIERLFSLERLDLRDNKISDPTELARLTGLPEIREIWVAGNPFTKTHSNYRTTIFNLFRSSPGYTDDIIIDGSGPGYSERRQLVERVAEKVNVPVVKPQLPEYEMPAVNIKAAVGPTEIKNEPAVLKKERPATATMQREGSYGSSRRKKTSRRRIVDLSTSEIMTTSTPPSVSFSPDDVLAAAAAAERSYGLSPEGPLPLSTSQYLPSEPRSLGGLPAAPRIDTNIDQPSYAAPVPRVSIKESQDWTVNGDIYKRKIEALRNEVGNNWLSVLNEEGWDSQKHHPNGTDFSPASTIRPSPTTPRANPQTIISGTRMLG
jgi:hypothetical protein